VPIACGSKNVHFLLPQVIFLLPQVIAVFAWQVQHLKA